MIIKFLKLFILLFISLFFIACETSDSSYFDGGESTQESITIKGVVKEYATDSTLSDVSITINTPSETKLLTLSDGLYETTLLSETDYILEFTKGEYYSISYVLSTTRETAQELDDVYLIPSSVETTSDASGVITSTSTAELLENVTLSLRQGINNKDGTVLESTTSLSDGSYSFEDIDVNTYTIQISLNEYEISYKTLYVAGGLSGSGQDFAISPMVFVLDGNNSVSGVIKSATTSDPLENVDISLRQGVDSHTGAIVGATTSAADGTYSVNNIASGNYTIEMSLDGYVTGYGNITSTDGESGENNNFALSPELADDEEMRLILTWNETPADLDSICLITTDTNVEERLYFGKKEISENGVVYGTLDADDQDGYGPETITINYFSSGKYIYFIKNYSTSTDLNASNASVQVIRKGEETLVIDIDPTTAGDYDYWEVMHIDNGIVTIKNNIVQLEPSL